MLHLLIWEIDTTAKLLGIETVEGMKEGTVVRTWIYGTVAGTIIVPQVETSLLDEMM